MKRIKLLVLFIAVFLLCGCSVTYKLDIDLDNRTFYESTDLYDLENETTKSTYSDLANGKVVTLTSDLPFGDYGEPSDSATYYETKEYRENGNYGTTFSNKFEASMFRDSNALNKCAENVSISNSGNSYKLQFGKFYCFKNYPELTSLRVNIKVNREVIYSNEDFIDNGEYVWLIHNANYNTKKVVIYFKMDNNKTFFDENSSGKTSEESDRKPEEKPTEPEEEVVTPEVEKEPTFAEKHPVLLILLAFGGFGLLLTVFIIIKKRKL